MESDRVRHRDDGLRRASSITRWIAAASAGAAALFAVLAAHPKVGTSGPARVSTDPESGASTDGSTTVNPDGSAADPGSSGADAVVPPAAPPVRSRSRPQVVTGSS